MNWKTVAAIILFAAVVLILMYSVMDPASLLVTLLVVLATGIPFWMWLGEKRTLARLAREKDKSTKASALVTQPAAEAEKKETVKVVTESVGISRRDRIARAFWFLWSPMFWIILVAVIILLYWLNSIDVLKVEDLTWPELSEGVRLALFFILLGLVMMLVLFPYLGRILLVLGVTMILLTLLLPHTMSWVSSGFSGYDPFAEKWTTLEVIPDSVSPSIPITAHKNFCVRIVGAPDTTEFFQSHTQIIPWGFSEWCPNDGGSFRRIRFVGSAETYTAQYKITDGSCT